MKSSGMQHLFLYVWLVILYSSSLVVIVGGTGGVLPDVRSRHQHNKKNDASEARKGPHALETGHALYERGKYQEAAMQYWKAVLFHSQAPAGSYDVQEVFSRFLECYTILGQPADGLAFVSLESFRRGQPEMGHNFLRQALEVDPDNAAALKVQKEYGTETDGNDDNNVNQRKKKKPSPTSSTAKPVKGTGTSYSVASSSNGDDIEIQSPEDLYAVASTHFSNKEYEACADIFEISCLKSEQTLGPSCAAAVYCRSMICDWGYNGTQFEADMKRIEELTKRETLMYRRSLSSSSEVAVNNHFGWARATSVHPHMMLGYPLPNLMLKRFVAESVAYMDELMARFALKDDTDPNELPPLPEGLPYPVDPEPWIQEKMELGHEYKIRFGFVGSGFNSKAVLYLSQDMFRFFDSSRFEIHVFSFNAPDSPLFLQHGMKGVDWRERVKSNVDHFHDLQHLVKNHIDAARYVRQQRIHVLIEWDGYARQGERAQGLFGLRPAPVQMLHQEYLGTSGALYVDYIFTDRTTSPLPDTQDYFTEQFIVLPNHFFSKGHALQAEVHQPSYEYTPRPAHEPYRLGTGTPQQNKCLAEDSNDVKFVFCNWNKFLKNNPETMRSWMEILRRAPGSILCLLENPYSGTAYVRKFVHEAAGTSATNNTTNWQDFQPGDGDELNRRIHFLPWEKNPFDHQRRNVDFCNVMLDSFPYNGHTVAQDALYAGVPIVTRSDGLDMSSRVTTSANLVLGLQDVLNAVNGVAQYQDMAVALGTNKTLFKATRTKLIDSALQRNPMHPYWDVPRYVKNFERGIEIAWNLFLDGQTPRHIHVEETEQTKAGTYDEEIWAHPPMGKRSSKAKP